MYDYQKLKPSVFTPEGQRDLLAVHKELLQRCRMLGGGVAHTMQDLTGGLMDNWQGMACVDWLVELGVLRESSVPGCLAQRRTFYKR